MPERSRELLIMRKKDVSVCGEKPSMRDAGLHSVHTKKYSERRPLRLEFIFGRDEVNALGRLGVGFDRDSARRDKFSIWVPAEI